MVLRRCRRLLRDEDAALDALQDVFARWLELDRDIPEYPSSFLYTMATRICIDRIRSASYRHRGQDALLEDIASAEDVEGASYARRLLDRIFGREEASTRVMAVMHFVDGMTYEEIAAEVDLSAAGVRRRLRRLRDNAERWNSGNKAPGAAVAAARGMKEEA
jgi:RNA polymerase sigma-70 factor (ECF subfamily)